ncbi:MAG: cyclic nucleotide-binding domain-containing protein [Gemmatimonadetes bacterium]|nr:MAG: cyclic nucleotide-binding domain-containing protein [Gemmatimonadota bacterium]
MADLERLRALPIFSDLARDEIEMVVDTARQVSYPAGACIVEEDKPSPHFYILVSGKVRLSKDIPIMGVQQMGILQPGDYLGEISLVSNYAQYLTATAMESCTLLEFHRDLFNQMLDEHRDLAYKMLRHLCHLQSTRLRDVNNLLKHIFATV